LTEFSARVDPGVAPLPLDITLIETENVLTADPKAVETWLGLLAALIFSAEAKDALVPLADIF
jgi:hypothetical protein